MAGRSWRDSPPVAAVARADRAAGRAIRRAFDDHPGAALVAGSAARAMSPAFRGLVALLIVRRGTRRTGVEALAASVLAATAARRLRGRIGRTRPGTRTEAGFPSRHAAASTAIARAVQRRHPLLGALVWAATAVGLVGRVQTGDHDPVDLMAGALTGASTETIISTFVGVILPEGPRAR